jgi:D-alanine-D-alanine ligase-like ATP-grasp enzyme
MSDTAALMKEKSELIQKMLEMQRQFVDYEHKNGISGKDYYYSQDGLLKDYREEYRNMAMRVVDIAHQVVGSVR